MWRHSKIKFPPNWEGELPPPLSRDELRIQLTPGFQQRNLSGDQIEETLDFFERYEAKYYEVTEGEQTGVTYHRPCGGGSTIQEETGIFCAKCLKLSNLIPPKFMR
ncbi:MAG: hypothetical protein A3D35_00440 [Candidatus Staskawiczbacteria bacterium RIFCSPHIGHO2_02_FULL_34_9]|uniref:Uncharacterized protein n=1 Tax=Candidatus Staskawiczbacteria bacterium RIFCSPHIGHO2_02_FULL_34_9 TaxID=1802206 RepID=A0A1G2HYK0_9BACT|nr:MAG: hypothetical protein A3D35_00440 [Candidatus Staskawiczbacteria bacterium RIFCSPHIGHO2_02_FULL_34_9]